MLRKARYEGIDAAFCGQLFSELREATGDGVGITRDAYGPGESRALDLLEAAAYRVGLEAARDAGANLVVTLPGTEPDLPFLACGSHLDSVLQGGNYDGAAGVVAGLAILAGFVSQGLHPRRSLRFYGLRGIPHDQTGRAGPFHRLRPEDESRCLIAMAASPGAPAGRSNWHPPS